ncbi:nuclear transport factor 2 family protein [Streptomyces sp. TLI_146]|uniref:nuclear transport factor 2 family protein n=1 Tax=Streptomyces sp. TLI_146 TaxID=1938858 RepID=UPI000C71285E|nr:nuclear transport factor 2 family protein [Streptomyces sp. TLI_146]PKV83556.1 SnoaL-like protein [Streptomyces sp. TLI_146]
MSASPQEIFQKCVYAGALTRNADAFAELFTEDGVLEAPLVPVDAAFPRRTEGRQEIRRTMAAYYERQSSDGGVPNIEKSRYVLHITDDPEVFIAEIDTVFDGDGDGDGDGADETVSLVQIYRVRDGKIAHLRDYFTPGMVS